MPRCMPRGEHATQAALPIGQYIPVLQEGISIPGRRCRHFRRICIPEPLHLLRRKPVPHILRKNVSPPALLIRRRQPRAVHPADVDPAPRADQFRRKPRVIAVQMGEKNVQPVPVHADLLQLVLHGRPAGVLPKARIDEKAPRPCQKVAVEIFQWVSNQGNIQPPKVFADPLRHGCSPHSRF